ncbi:MAG: hypothetical protein ABI377_10810 [Devosia sp.]
MRLTTYTDYTLRVLIQLTLRPRGLTTIAEIANSYGISEVRDAFLGALERYTLADLVAPRRKLAALLKPEARPL